MSRLNVANFRHPDGTADNINLDSSGRVGIGTSDPKRHLHIHETATGTNTYLQLSNPGTGQTNTDGFQLICADDGEAIVMQRENQPLSFYTNNTERARITSTGDLRFNSGYGSVATAYGCRAWVNFDGGASSIGSGRANGNVSSVSDNGTGQYTVNFSNAFPDNDYAVAQFCRADSGGGMRVCVGRGTSGFQTTSLQVEIRNGNNNLQDVEEVCLAFFR